MCGEAKLGERSASESKKGSVIDWQRKREPFIFIEQLWRAMGFGQAFRCIRSLKRMFAKTCPNPHRVVIHRRKPFMKEIFIPTNEKAQRYKSTLQGRVLNMHFHIN